VDEAVKIAFLRPTKRTTPVGRREIRGDNS
jgi:hypothetical protein